MSDILKKSEKGSVIYPVYYAACHFSIYFAQQTSLPRCETLFLVRGLSVTAPVQKEQDVKEQIDEIQIQLQRGENRGFFEKLRISGKGHVVFADLGCIVRREAQENDDSQIAESCLQAAQIHEHGNKAKDNQEEQAAN